jgi:hypothetical protein
MIGYWNHVYHTGFRRYLGVSDTIVQLIRPDAWD